MILVNALVEMLWHARSKWLSFSVKNVVESITSVSRRSLEIIKLKMTVVTRWK